MAPAHHSSGGDDAFSTVQQDTTNAVNAATSEPVANVSYRPRKRRMATVSANVSKAALSLPKAAKKMPPKPKGFYWVASGRSGWKLHESKKVDGVNRLVGYLNKDDFKELKAQFKGTELAEQLLAKATARKAEQ